jgi:predicted DNA-binding WGR domain protein
MSETGTNKVYLEFTGKNSYKFYELLMDGTSVTVTYGRIGHTGTQQEKNFSDPDKAVKFFNRQLKQKVKIGYRRAVKGERLPKLKFLHVKQLPLPFGLI